MNRFTINGLTVTIMQDQDAEMPFCDGILIYYRKASRYTLGTTRATDSELQKLESSVSNGKLYGLPVYAYIHSGISLSTSPFSCPWDSGQSGIAVAAKSEFKDEAEAHECIRSFINEFNQFMSGDVWGYTIEDEEGNHLDSCWGFYGIEYCKEQATEAAQSIAKNLQSETYAI